MRWVGGYMLFTGVGLTLAWTAQWANFMVAGAAPAIGEEAFQLVAAMDLTFMVPWFLLGAGLIIRRRRWGFVIAPIIVAKGATYTLVLTATSTVAAMRDVSDTAEEILIWAAWTVAGAGALWGLLANLGGPTGRQEAGTAFSTTER